MNKILADALNEELIAGAAVEMFLPEPPEKKTIHYLQQKIVY